MKDAPREAILLPVLFLTVGLLGGLRITDTVTFHPPAPFTLVLALLMVGVLVRSGVFAHERPMNPSRSTIANCNGLLLLTVFFASAQALSLATPDTGLPRVAVYVLSLILLLSTRAASPDRKHLFGRLLVIFGSGFTLKFAILTQMGGPADGPLERVVRWFVRLGIDVASLGMVLQQPLHPATAFVAFFTLVLFLFGLTLLLPDGGDASSLPAVHE